MNPKITTISIGKQCTLFKKNLDITDYTIGGESELFTSNFIMDISLGKTYSSKYIDAGVISCLDELPMPSYELLSKEQIQGHTAQREMELAPSALFETMRGCPGQCSFCQRKGWGETIRYISDDKVMSTFAYLLNSGIKNFWVVDENFTANLDRAKRILTKLAKIRNGRSVKIALSSWTKIDDSFIETAKAAGVSLISFGIESVVPQNQEFFNKIIDIPDLLHILEKADSCGIFTVGNFIIGTPHETLETIRESLDFAIKSPLDEINIKILDYMMGSALYESLPQDQKGEIHFFASKERGICNFTLKELRAISSNYSRIFKISRSNNFSTKYNTYGPPYYKDNESYA
jgi:radical SAM superfamily enzyme YgiQ (UPF0313 family)